MKKKMTSVSIAKTPIPTEIQKLIKTLASMSVDNGIAHDRVIWELAKSRNAYKKTLVEIPEEDEHELKFRRKVVEFFERTDILPIGNLGYNGYQLNCANYHIEAMCAAYRLFNSGDKLSITNIYKVAKYKMEPNEEYMASIKGRNMQFSHEWHLIDKQSNIRGLRNYFEALANDYFFKTENALKLCNKFLNKYEYHPSEEAWLKMVYIISNF